MNPFSQILAINDGPVAYEGSGKGHIKMVGHAFPYSILEPEFNFLTAFILAGGHKRGYECATAFGVSTMAIGLGFKATGGKLVTMDAYIEEANDNPEVYEKMDATTYENADGFKSVNHLIKHFGLEDTVFPVVGWSPTDVEKVVRAVHGDNKLDFAFIDAGHFPEQIIADVNAIYPLMDHDNYRIVFHDCYEWSGLHPDVVNFVKNLTGRTIEVVLPFPHGENLGVLA